MLFRFCLYGFLKNQRYFEPFLMLVFLDQGFSFFVIGLLLACRDLTVNLLEIPSGAIADSFGRRASMVISFLAYIVSFLTLGTASGIVFFFIGMVLYGIGDTFRTGTHKAMIFEWLRLQGRSEERTEIYGQTRSWSQIGSALSGVIAAAFVLISGSYAYVFYFAVVPYVLNLANLATYPRQLDGDHAKAQSLRESMRRMWKSLKSSFSKRPLRRVMIESMGWEGVFSAVKDYLQPVLQSVAIVALANFFGNNPHAAGGAPGETGFNEARTTALLIGPVYAILFLLSAWASRNSHRFVKNSNSEIEASRKLWCANTLIYASIALAAWFQLNVVLVVAFVLLHMLKNVWRPILITRFDSHSTPEEGATILSIESQAQRLATLVMAPILGGMIDMVRAAEWGGEFWPIGVVGGLIAMGMFFTAARSRE